MFAERVPVLKYTRAPSEEKLKDLRSMIKFMPEDDNVFMDVCKKKYDSKIMV